MRLFNNGWITVDLDAVVAVIKTGDTNLEIQCHGTAGTIPLNWFQGDEFTQDDLRKQRDKTYDDIVSAWSG